MLALIGGGLGVLLAAWAVPALMALGPSDISDVKHIGLNLEVLGFSVAVSVLSGILFGLAPAFHSSRENLSGIVKRRGARQYQQPRKNPFDAGRDRSRALAGSSDWRRADRQEFRAPDEGRSGLRFRSSLGFRHRTSTFRRPRQQQDAFYQQVQDRVEALPGVQSAGAVSRLPLAAATAIVASRSRAAIKSMTPISALVRPLTSAQWGFLC